MTRPNPIGGAPGATAQQPGTSPPRRRALLVAAKAGGMDVSSLDYPAGPVPAGDFRGASSPSADFGQAPPKPAGEAVASASPKLLSGPVGDWAAGA
jgi:hypothetical protein